MFSPGVEPRNSQQKWFSYELKNFSLSPGIEPDSSSPESPSYTTRPPSHNLTLEHVVYIQ